MVLLLLILITFHSALWGEARTQNSTSCSSIETADIENSTFQLGAREVLTFVDGKICTCDEDGGAIGEGERCDWENMIIMNEVIQPPYSSKFRLVIVNSNHLTGSGTWDYVILFACQEEKLTKVFERQYLYGAQITMPIHSEFYIVSAFWEDPTCCPIRKKLERFRWNGRNTYELVDTTVINSE